jgi:hypothetical protein
MKRGRRPALTAEQVDHVRNLYHTSSCSMERIAGHFDVSPATIERVIMHRAPYNYRRAGGR